HIDDSAIDRDMEWRAIGFGETEQVAVTETVAVGADANLRFAFAAHLLFRRRLRLCSCFFSFRGGHGAVFSLSGGGGQSAPLILPRPPRSDFRPSIGETRFRVEHRRSVCVPRNAAPDRPGQG